jgi:hypothetical protein
MYVHSLVYNLVRQKTTTLPLVLKLCFVYVFRSTALLFRYSADYKLDCKIADLQNCPYDIRQFSLLSCYPNILIKRNVCTSASTVLYCTSRGEGRSVQSIFFGQVCLSVWRVIMSFKYVCLLRLFVCRAWLSVLNCLSIRYICLFSVSVCQLQNMFLHICVI